jgi:hypothetical protein
VGTKVLVWSAGAVLTWIVWAEAAAKVDATRAAKIVRCKPFTPENLEVYVSEVSNVLIMVVNLLFSPRNNIFRQERLTLIQNQKNIPV